MIKKAASVPFEPVTPAEIRALRDELEETQEELAATLGVTVREVRAWEAGTLPVPRHEAQWIRHFLGINARSRAAVEADIRGCAWLDNWRERFTGAFRAADITRLVAQAERHMENCPQCLQMKAWEETQPPIPPAPVPKGWAGVLVAFFDWVQSLPAWLRPAAYGVALFGGVTLLRVVLILLLDPSIAAAGEALKAVLVGSTLGAIGGLTWAAVREPLRPLGRARPFVGGAMLGVVGALAMGVFFTLTGDPEMSLTTPGGWVMLPIAALVSGPVLGFTILREDKDG